MTSNESQPLVSFHGLGLFNPTLTPWEKGERAVVAGDLLEMIFVQGSFMTQSGLVCAIGFLGGIVGHEQHPELVDGALAKTILDELPGREADRSSLATFIADSEPRVTMTLLQALESGFEGGGMNTQEYDAFYEAGRPNELYDGDSIHLGQHTEEVERQVRVVTTVYDEDGDEIEQDSDYEYRTFEEEVEQYVSSREFYGLIREEWRERGGDDAAMFFEIGHAIRSILVARGADDVS